MAPETHAIGLAADDPMLDICFLDDLPAENEVEVRQLAGIGGSWEGGAYAYDTRTLYACCQE